MSVPEFQRRFSWKKGELNDYWEDIEKARSEGSPYFMGTIVLASDTNQVGRSLIVDGQQRITTTALLLTAVRDRLREFGKEEAANSVERDHLSDYVLSEERHVAKLALAPRDSEEYEAILEGMVPDDASPIGVVTEAYLYLKRLVDGLADSEDEYKSLIQLVTYLDTSVQVLLAIASGLPEAYVIFETLNDRGADLTTADLLKNYVFSSARGEIDAVREYWTELSTQFDKPEYLVKFLRQEYMSRKGRVTHRELYKALRQDIGNDSRDVKRYMKRLLASYSKHKALSEPDNKSWSPEPEDVRDSLLALRRFRLESAMPLLLAVFSKWDHNKASKFVNRLVPWFFRAWSIDSLGGSTAEKAICQAAVAVTNRTANTSDEVLDMLRKSPGLIPDDSRFRVSFIHQGEVSNTRAKYILGQLEKVRMRQNGESSEGHPDWSAKYVSIEHVFARSSKRSTFSSDDEFKYFSTLRDTLGNFVLLERQLNNSLEDRPFSDKRETYCKSKFILTRDVGIHPSWTFNAAETRLETLGDLALVAWPL